MTIEDLPQTLTDGPTPDGLRLGAAPVSIQGVADDGESAREVTTPVAISAETSPRGAHDSLRGTDPVSAEPDRSESPTAITAMPQRPASETDLPTFPLGFEAADPDRVDELATAPPVLDMLEAPTPAASFVWSTDVPEDPTTGVRLRPPPVSLPTETVPRGFRRPATRPPSRGPPAPTVEDIVAPRFGPALPAFPEQPPLDPVDLKTPSESFDAAAPATRPETALPMPSDLGDALPPPPPRDFASEPKDPDATDPPVPTAYRAGPDGREDPRFGDYVLLGQVGSGGMAEIQLAVQVGAHGFHKPCVIKRISLERAHDEDHQQLFREEGKICMRLRHANIVKFYEFGEVSEIPYIAMELVDGVDLARLDAMTGGEGLPLRVVLEIGYHVADALAYAHALAGEQGQALNLIHRDVSPQNILVSREGEVKLADFGIARFDGRVFETGVGPPKGKLRYIAPEQLIYGERPDGRVDLFSLGMVLAEIITRNPFMPEGPLVSGEVEPLMRAAFDRHPKFVPPVLVDLLVWMTKQGASERPASADEVATRLRGIERTLHAQERLAEFVPSRIASRLPSAEKVIFRLLEGGDPSRSAAEILGDPTAPVAPSFPSGRLAQLPVGVLSAYPTVALVHDLEEQAAVMHPDKPDSLDGDGAPTIIEAGAMPLPESAIVGPAPATGPLPVVAPRSSTPPPSRIDQIPGWWWALLGALLAAVAAIVLGVMSAID